MAIRKIVSVMATLLILLGLSQLAFTTWWLQRLPALVDSRGFYIWGLPGVIFGVILLVAVLERAVGLRPLMAVLGLLVLASGVLVLAGPELIKGALRTMVIDRARGFQVFVIWVSGILRMAIGFVIIYAVIRPPAAVHREAADVGPEQ